MNSASMTSEAPGDQSSGTDLLRRSPPSRRRRRGFGLVLYVVTGAIVGIAVFGPLLAPHTPGQIVAAPFVGPGSGGLLGTDHLGRDVWSRVLAGGRPLLLVPLIATAATCALGTLLGMLAGYLGGWVEVALWWATRVLLVTPAMLVLLVILNGWGYGDITLIVAVALTGCPFVARLARSATLRAAHSGFAEQAAGLGESTLSVLLREITPNIAGPMLADAGMRLVAAIDIVAAAGFLGFGPDTANWASMINENRDGLTLAPWSVAAPTIALGALAVSVNLTMDRLTRRLIR